MTNCAFYDVRYWELWDKILLLGCRNFCFVNYVAYSGTQLYLTFLRGKFIVKMFVVCIMQIVFINQLVNAWFKHDAIKMSENKFEIFGTNTLKWLCEVSPNLFFIVSISIFYFYCFFTLFNNRYTCKTANWTNNLFKLIVW